MDELELKLGETVTFIRTSPEGTAIRGTGVVVAKLIGINKRLNITVKEGDKAWNLEPQAINCKDEDEAAYFAHVNKIREVAVDYNKRGEELIKEGNKVIDDMNSEFFGPPFDVE